MHPKIMFVICILRSGICADGCWSSCSSTSSSPPPHTPADDTLPLMSPNDGSGRPARHPPHTRLSALHHEGGGLKEHPPEVMTNAAATTTTSSSIRTPRKRPLEPRSPHSVNNSRKLKSPRVTSSLHLSTSSPSDVCDISIVGASQTTPINGVALLPRATLAGKNGVTMRRVNGVTNLPNGHITPEALQYAIDAKFATLDAKINGNSINVNIHDSKINGLNCVRQSELASRNSSHEHKQNDVDVRLNGHNELLNVYSDHKHVKSTDARCIIEPGPIDNGSRLNDLRSRHLIDNRINGAESLHGVSSEAPTLQSRLPLPDTRPNSDLRHSPRHSLFNGLSPPKPHLLNNNSKTSLNNNTNIKKNGYVQPQFLVTPPLKNSVSSIQRLPEVPLIGGSRGQNVCATGFPPTTSSSVIQPRQINNVPSIRVPVYPCPTIATATAGLKVPQHVSPRRVAVSGGSDTASSAVPAYPVASACCLSASTPSPSSSNNLSGATTPSVPVSGTAASSLPGSSPNISLSKNVSSKQPSVVRFPAVPSKKDLPEVCRWKDCGKEMDPNTSLLEHIQVRVLYVNYNHCNYTYLDYICSFVQNIVPNSAPPSYYFTVLPL